MSASDVEFEFRISNLGYYKGIFKVECPPIKMLFENKPSRKVGRHVKPKVENET